MGGQKHLCFVYGTLVYSEVVEALQVNAKMVGKAKLNGYSRSSLKGERYPAIHTQTPEGTNSVVEGIVLELQSDEDLERFDWFENVNDVMYIRKTVQVSCVTSEGETKEIKCDTYVAGPSTEKKILFKEWSIEFFRKVHLDEYLEDIAMWLKEEVKPHQHE